MATPTMKQVVQAIGAPDEAAEWSKRIAAWDALYACQGKDIEVQLKDGTYKRRRRTLNMAKRIAEDWAGLLWTEASGVETGDESTDEVLEAYVGEKFSPTMTAAIERTMAHGTGALEVLIDGLTVSPSGEPVSVSGVTVRVETVNAANIVPLTWNSVGISEVAFVTFMPRGFSVRSHLRDGENALITNREFRVVNNQVSEVTPDELIAAGIAPVIRLIGAPQLFAVMAPAIVNNVDSDSPYGISVFANAEDHLDTVDLVWDNFAEDFELGGKMVFMSDTLLRRGEKSEQYPLGKPIPPQKEKANLFVPVDDATGDGNLIKEHNPDLRVDSNAQGLEVALGMLSAAVGMGSARYRYRDGGVQTATQFISEDSDLFRTRRKHLLVVVDAVQTVTRALLWCLASLAGESVVTDSEIHVRVDDSVIEDDGARQARAVAKVQAGVMSLYRYLTEVEGMTEEAARSEIAEMTTAAPPLF